MGETHFETSDVSAASKDDIMTLSWIEIDKLFVTYEDRQPGDIDYHDFMERYKVGQNTAHMRMDELVQSGKFRFVWIKGNAGAPIRVIRRI